MNRRSVIPILLFGSVCLFFPDITFAESEFMKGLFDKLDFILRLLGWLWIVPATLAGKLLTNQYVFGEFLGLNTYLWRMWQIMRNFANFALGGLFLRYLLETLFNAGAVSELGKKIVKLSVAGILLNASWFLLKALVDLSLVATTAVSSLPVSLLEKSRDQQRYDSLVLERYHIEDGLTQGVKNNNTKTTDISLEAITPDANNMAGPIVYMGTAILGFLSSDFLPLNAKNGETLLLIVSLKVIVLILFTMPLLVLLVTNTLRIFWIRIRIITSPFLAIYFVLGDSAPSGLKGMASSLRAEGLGALLGLIFQPMVVVGALSVGLLLITSIASMMSGGSEYSRLAKIGDMQFYHTPDPTFVGENGTVTVEGSEGLFKQVEYRAFGFFGDVILTFFVTFILWAMVRVGSEFSSVTKEVSGKMLDVGKDLAMSIPIVPMMGGQSVGSLKQNAGKIVKNASGAAAFERKMQEDAANYSNTMYEKLTGNDPNKQGISSTQLQELNPSGNTSTYRTKFGGYTSGKTKDGIMYTGNIEKAASNFFGSSPKSAIDKLRVDYNNTGLFSTLNKELLTDGYSFKDLEKTPEFANFMASVAKGQSADEIVAASQTRTSRSLGVDLLK